MPGSILGDLVEHGIRQQARDIGTGLLEIGGVPGLHRAVFIRFEKVLEFPAQRGAIRGWAYILVPAREHAWSEQGLTV